MDIDGYYINLARDQVRRKTLEAQLRRHGWTPRYRRFEAVDGSRLALDSPLSPGALGCWMSHLGVLELGRGRQRILHVLEDDADLDAQLPQALAALAGKQEWDLIFSDVFFHPPLNPEQFIRVARALQAQRARNSVQLLPLARLPFTGTTSYFVHPRAITRLHAAMARGWQQGLGWDVALQRLVAAGQFKAFVFLPFLSGVSAEAKSSTIGGHGPAETELYLLRAALRVGADLPALADRLPGHPFAERHPLLRLYLASLAAALDPLLEASSP
ncbi:MAG TPA: glycosyltransferase family 25 protein [Solimonas sp.]|nr:glycosyltransferase family 25 protein [Solimonas sp.]